MRTALFLFGLFLFSILFIFIITINTLNAKAKNPQQVKVAAYVDEHLTYLLNGEILNISTNRPGDYLVLSDNGTLIGKIKGRTDFCPIFIKSKKIIIVPEF